MTPDIELLRELLAKATPPWEIQRDGHAFPLAICTTLDGDVDGDTGQHIIVGGDLVAALPDDENAEDNAALIVEAVNALPALLDEITRLHTLPAPSEAQPCERCAARDRDWWKPEPEDPYWMLEAEDGEWLKNAYSLLGTRDATKAIRFPTMHDAASHPATMKAGSKWWNAKPTEHSWISAESVTAMQKAKP